MYKILAVDDEPHALKILKLQEWDEYEGVEAGAIHYLSKPCTQEKLLAVLEAVLRNVDALKEHFLRKSISGNG